MNIFKIIDAFFFGTDEDYEEINQCEKLWFYLPIAYGFVVLLLVLIIT